MEAEIMISIESPTRVTLALDIIKRLEDGPLRGYHELGIVKHQIAIADTLHVEPYSGNRDIVECDDPRVPADSGNICVKACEIVRARLGKNGRAFGPLKITIEKRIPVMGGMAGGSANAAAMLRAVDKLWELGLTAEQLRGLGRELGMDVPFFFTGGTAFDSETTGIIEPVNTNLNLHIILAIPDFGISTKNAYGAVDYGRIGKNVMLTDEMRRAFRDNDFDGVAKCLHNDFELTAFERYPRLGEIRNNLLKAGCAATCMSGSGSTIIGIAADKSALEETVAEIDCVDCRVIVTETLTTP
jgi:4-diphosphocytidyl-2-C-methyl-D-erythritol kinase